MKVFVSDQADADLLQIYRYVAERNPAAAESIAREINGKFENLSLFPFIGRDRSTLAKGNPERRGLSLCDLLHGRG